MIDFWALLGHAVTDDPFRTQLKTFSTTYPPVAVPPNTYACRFDDRDYNNLRPIVAAIVGPVSLMALGEWLVVSKLHAGAFPYLDAASGIAQGLLGGYSSTDRQFYQLLGACIVDQRFQNDFLAGQEGNYGFNLTAPDRTALATVVNDGGFQGQAGSFQGASWTTGGCKDMAYQWAANPYAHSLETTFP